MIRTPLAVLLALSTALAPMPAFAWGATGHEFVSGAAIDGLPADAPAFLKTKTARDQIALLGREPDRWKGAGDVHDIDREGAHFIDIDDTGLAEGLAKLDALPPTKVEWEAMVLAKGVKPRNVGYLPYSIIDGYQQVVKDFGYWRASRMGAKNAKTKADRDWFTADEKLREMLTLRDIGVLTHYIGDGSQPMHVSIHFAGWTDKYPDPMSYPPPGGRPEVKTVHNYFEGPFVKEHVTLAAVRKAMTPYADCACPIEQQMRTYLTTTLTQVRPLYELVAAGGLRDSSSAAIEFATRRVAAGASEARDMIEDAWKASAHASVGYPNINVADIESGKVILSRLSYGAD